MSLRIRHADVPPLSGGLPPEWAAGFPRLQALRLEELRVSQPTLPAAWAQRGFPMLQTLMLDGLGLNGTLPATLLPAHPGLRVLGLANSRLSGPLPADWGAHQVGIQAGPPGRGGCGVHRMWPSQPAQHRTAARASLVPSQQVALAPLPASWLGSRVVLGPHRNCGFGLRRRASRWWTCWPTC